MLQYREEVTFIKLSTKFIFKECLDFVGLDSSSRRNITEDSRYYTILEEYMQIPWIKRCKSKTKRNGTLFSDVSIAGFRSSCLNLIANSESSILAPSSQFRLSLCPPNQFSFSDRCSSFSFSVLFILRKNIFPLDFSFFYVSSSVILLL